MCSAVALWEVSQVTVSTHLPVRQQCHRTSIRVFRWIRPIGTLQKQVRNLKDRISLPWGLTMGFRLSKRLSGLLAALLVLVILNPPAAHADLRNPRQQFLRD